MSFERVGRPSRPLIPGDLEGRIATFVAQGLGALLLLIAAIGWLALATWSASDPSLTHTTSSAVRNWLGAVGAIGSDLALQMLGFAAILVFLGPAGAGLVLVLEQRVSALRIRLGFFPLALLALAGALSALPAPNSWPLNHGLGGLVGDAVLGFAAGILAVVNPARAALVAGLVLFAAGMWLLSASLGISSRDWTVLLAKDPAEKGGGLVAGLMARAEAARRKALERRAAEEAVSAPDAGWAPPGDNRAAAMREPAVTVASRDRDEPRPAAMSAAAAASSEAGTGAGAARMPAAAVPRPVALPAAAAADQDTEPDEPDAPQEQPVALPAFLTAYRRKHNAGAAEPEAAVAARATAPPAPRAATPTEAVEMPADRGSRAMARRFAPAAAAPAGNASAGAGGVRRGIGRIFTLRAAEPAWRRPSLNLLKRPAAVRPGPEHTQPVLRGSARLLEDALEAFGIKGEVKAIRPGPVVTRFELEPERGTKPARIAALADDIARAMSAQSARVATIPGRTAVGIEVPNVRRETVCLRELLDADAWRTADGPLPLALGKDIAGEPVIADLARMPHLLVAGAPGSGLTVGLNALILSLVYRHAPGECRLLLIDPRMLDLAVYNNVPHLLAPVITGPGEAVVALAWAVAEMEERYKRMAELGVRNVDIYNNRVRNAKKRGELMARTVQTGYDEATGEPRYEEETLDLEPMPWIVVVVSEIADLMAVAGRDVETAVQRLSQMSRAAGIHLVLATQRPTPDVVTPALKASLPVRLAYRLAGKVDSRAVLDEQGAEQLLGAGDGLLAAGPGQIVRVHGAFVADDEAEHVAAALREQGEPQWHEDLVRTLEQRGPAGTGAASASPGVAPDEAEDDLFDRAVAIVHREQKASVSALQRRLGISWGSAAGLVARMEREGLVSAPDGAGRRRVLEA